MRTSEQRENNKVFLTKRLKRIQKKKEESTYMNELKEKDLEAYKKLLYIKSLSTKQDKNKKKIEERRLKAEKRQARLERKLNQNKEENKDE